MKTKCWTYGEMRRECHTMYNANGSRAGHITLADFKSICGKWVDDASDANFDVRRRPAGVCKACWAQHKLDRVKIASEEYGETP
jgi:hypothetical protein